MSEQAMRYRSGLVIEGDAESVVRGLETMVHSYSAYLESARTASELWRQNNNAESLARALIVGLPNRIFDGQPEAR